MRPLDSLGLDPLGSIIGSGPVLSANINLLRWTEEFDNVVWSKSDVVIVADADGVADRATFGITGGAVMSQLSQTVAAAGAPVNLGIVPTPNYVRYDLGGTFDGQLYTASIELKAALAASITMALLRNSGFLMFQLLSTDDVDNRVIFVKNAQLERGPLSAYMRRTT